MRPTPRAPTVAKEVAIEAAAMKVMAIETTINKVVIIEVMIIEIMEVLMEASSAMVSGKL